jgi:DNA-binding transcriptional MerR regulator
MNPYSELEIFLKSEHVNHFPELCSNLLEKRFTASQAGITHRWITYWDKEGLLFSKTEKEKWRKFSFIEYVWLRIIRELRKYHISIKIIRNLKNALLTEYHLVDLLDSKDVVDIVISRVPDHLKDEVRNYLKNKDQIKKEFPAEFFSILYLFTLDAIVLKSHIALLVNQGGEFIPFKENYIEKYQEITGYYEFIHKSYVSVSITEIVSDFIKGRDLKTTSHQMALLTDKEAEIIRLIREEKLSSLKIRFDKNHQIDLLEVCKEQQLDKEARFIDLIMSKGYHDIEVKIEKGEVVYCENIRKIKLGK